MTEKPRTPFMTWRHWGIAGVLVFIIGIAVGLLVGLLGGEQRGWIAGALAGALAAVTRISWPLRHERWFWAAVTAFLGVDILAMTFADWSFAETWPGRAFGGFASLDIAAMLAIVYGIYRLKYGAPKKHFEESPDDLPQYSGRDIDL
jgi:hypothetical protein